MALILAVTLFPLHQKLANKLDGKQGRAATIFVLSGILFIGIPTVMLSGSMVDFVQQTHTKFKNDSISIKEPAPDVAQWPIVERKFIKYGVRLQKNCRMMMQNFRPIISLLKKFDNKT